METSSLTFHDFLDRMRNPASMDLVRSIKSFIVSFSFCGPNPENDGKKVQEFYTTMETAFVNHPLWSAATDQDIDSAMEALEKYVMTKLFPRTFALSQEDTNLDLQISHKINLLQTFFHPRHLDIPPILIDQQSLLLAEKELHKINAFKAPSEKLRCIVNCCKVINNVLLGASMSESHSIAGADSFLPLLINATIKANPPQLHSNLRYIELYRRKTKLISEDAYYFTNLVSSKTFITDLNAKSLSMDEIAFEESMESAKQIGDFTIEEHLSLSTTALDHTPFGPMARIRDSNAGGINYPYMEAEAGDLTVKDVEVLLSAYKDVVAKYTRLSTAIKRDSFTKSLEIQSTSTTSPTEILPSKEETSPKTGESGGE